MKHLVFILFLITGCSDKKSENHELPVYSDMGAAADAGKATK